MIYSGFLEKMRISPAEPVAYSMVMGEQEIALAPMLGKRVTLTWSGKIQCRACSRATNKSFNQGYCYSCFTKLAECDMCIMSPEKCHYAAGTCRDPAWGEKVCFNDHIVYLANSSGLKVGITRMKNMPSRWLDQGAAQALPIARTASRFLAGKIEDTLRQKISDKTNWRSMLKDSVGHIDLVSERDALLEQFDKELNEIADEHGTNSVTWLKQETTREFTYPVTQYPTKVVSHNLDKTQTVTGVLMGVKGQYLMLDTGVINIRKYTSYHIQMKVEETASQGQLAL